MGLTLTPSSARPRVVSWKTTEAMVQFKLCEELGRLGIPFMPECTVRTSMGRCRIDIAIGNPTMGLVAAVEVKRNCRYHQLRSGSRQGQKYGLLGVPVLLCRNITEVPDVAAKCLEVFRCR